ncbi:MAG: Fe-S-cluster containining protein [Verrucomicrobiales bacterium]
MNIDFFMADSLAQLGLQYTIKIADSLAEKTYFLHPHAMNETHQTVATVLDIYARHIEARPLPRQCELRTECCRFRLTGKTPMVTRGEAITAAYGWRASGRKEIPENGSTGKSSPADGACPFLASDGRCGNYKHRPLGCRTHFCDPAGGPYPRQHVIDAIRELEALDETLGGDGPRPLPAGALAVWDRITKTKKSPNARRGRNGKSCR